MIRDPRSVCAVALMGSSGAGKSTLLNCLSGRVSTGLRGEVEMNGMPCTPQLCKELGCFIQQEDIIFGYLTVEEHLFFQVFAQYNMILDVCYSWPTCSPTISFSPVISVVDCEDFTVGLSASFEPAASLLGALKGLISGSVCFMLNALICRHASVCPKEQQ